MKILSIFVVFLENTNFIGFSKFMCDCDDSEAQSEREEASASVLM